MGMKKLFVQLISELKRLGGTVVSADFNRIILCTKKRTLEDAISYVDYITTTVRSKELFHSIDMRFSQAWEYLLWCDPSNYGGVKCARNKIPKSPAKPAAKKGGDGEDSDNDDDQEGNKESDAEEEEEEGPEIEMQWNLASYLPEAGACQKNFSTVVAGYITANYQFLQEEMERVVPGMTPIRRRRNQSQTQGSTPGRRSQKVSATGEPQTLEDYVQELVSGELAQSLFTVTHKIHKKLPEQLGGDEEESVFPILPGSHLKFTNPALEFVKSLCKVLSLDTAITDQVNKLRRNLLKLINVGEFSDCADWKDPCISFVLPEVICKQCNHCRDIDLCKDAYVSQTETTAGSVSHWLCASADCRAPYDTPEIEHLLLDAVQRKTMGYVLQDLTCQKCSQVKDANMAKYCTCAGKFKVLHSKHNILQLLKTFSSIAKHFKMPLLS